MGWWQGCENKWKISHEIFFTTFAMCFSFSYSNAFCLGKHTFPFNSRWDDRSSSEQNRNLNFSNIILSHTENEEKRSKSRKIKYQVCVMSRNEDLFLIGFRTWEHFLFTSPCRLTLSEGNPKSVMRFISLHSARAPQRINKPFKSDQSTFSALLSLVDDETSFSLSIPKIKWD